MFIKNIKNQPKLSRKTVVVFLFTISLGLSSVLSAQASSSCRDVLLQRVSQIQFKRLTPELWTRIRAKLHCIETSNQYFSAGDYHGSSGNSTGDFGTSRIAINDVGRVYLGDNDERCDLITTVRGDDELYEYFSMAYADIVLQKLDKCTRKIKNGKIFSDLSVDEQAAEVAVYGWYLPGKYCSGKYNDGQKANIKGRLKRLHECEKILPEPDLSRMKLLTEASGVAEFKFSDFEEYLGVQLSDRIVDLDNDAIFLPIKIGLLVDERIYSRTAERKVYGNWQVISINNPAPLREYGSPYIYDGDILASGSDRSQGPALSGIIRLPLGLRIMPFDLQRVLSSAAENSGERKIIKRYVEIGNIKDVNYLDNPLSKVVLADDVYREFPVNPFRGVYAPVPGKYRTDFWARSLWKDNPYYAGSAASQPVTVASVAAGSYSGDCACDKDVQSPTVKMTAMFARTDTSAAPAEVGQADISAKIRAFLSAYHGVQEVLSARTELRNYLGISYGDLYTQSADLDGDNEREIIISRLDGLHGDVNAIVDLHDGFWSVSIFENPGMYVQRILAEDVTNDGVPEIIYDGFDGAVSSHSISVYSYKNGGVREIGDLGSYEEGEFAVRRNRNSREIQLVSYPKYDGIFLDSAQVRPRRVQQYRWNGEGLYLYKESYPDEYSINVLFSFLEAVKGSDYAKLCSFLHPGVAFSLMAEAAKYNGSVDHIEVLRRYFEAAYPELCSFMDGEIIPVDGGKVHDLPGLEERVDADILRSMRDSRYFGELRFRKLYGGRDVDFRLVMLWENNKWSIVTIERLAQNEDESSLMPNEFVFDKDWEWKGR